MRNTLFLCNRTAKEGSNPGMYVYIWRLRGRVVVLPKIEGCSPKVKMYYYSLVCEHKPCSPFAHTVLSINISLSECNSRSFT